MPKMTIKEMYAGHQGLWFWLADNPEKWKDDWSDWEEHGYQPSNCFPCGWCDEVCANCPLDWPDGRCMPHDTMGLYREWRNSVRGSDHRALMADLIANVPLKKELK